MPTLAEQLHDRFGVTLPSAADTVAAVAETGGIDMSGAARRDPLADALASRFAPEPEPEAAEDDAPVTIDIGQGARGTIPERRNPYADAADALLEALDVADRRSNHWGGNSDRRGWRTL